MYTPDPTFMKDLKALDGRLGCEFNRDHEHFVVTYKRATGEPIPLRLVKDDSGGFRQPDRREIDFLKQADNERESVRSRLQRTTKYMEDYRANKKKVVKDDIRGRTKDDKIQLSNAFRKLARDGKANATFRRIDPKPKGYTVRDLRKLKEA